MNFQDVIRDVHVPDSHALKTSDSTLSGVLSDNSIGVSSAKYSLQSHFESVTGWTESAGADNLATSVEHRGEGNYSLEFDKIAGDATAMISKTIDSFDMSAYSIHAIGVTHVYISDLTNVDYAFVRIGTDASNYCQWNFDGGLLTAGWNKLNEGVSTPTSQTGNGYDLSAITYLAFGVVFDAAANTLTDIRTGGWSIARVLEISEIAASDVQVTSPQLTIKDQNSNTRLDVAAGGTYNYLYNRNTDGTNLMPTMDAAARAGYQQIVGNVTLSPSINSIGFATVSVAAIAAGNNNIGDVDVATIAAGANYIGLASVNIGGTLPALAAGTNFIGLVTAWTRNAGTAKTLISLPVGLGANSLATIAVPTNANKINATNLILSSNVTTEVAIKSGVTYLTGNASLGITLFPGGGFEMPGSPDSPAWIGLPSGAMVIEKRDTGGTVSKIGGGVIYFDE